MLWNAPFCIFNILGGPWILLWLVTSQWSLIRELPENLSRSSQLPDGVVSWYFRKKHHPRCLTGLEYVSLYVKLTIDGIAIDMIKFWLQLDEFFILFWHDKILVAIFFFHEQQHTARFKIKLLLNLFVNGK